MSGNIFEDIKMRANPYIINSLFDAVFTIMGIVIGSTFSATLDLRSIIGTIVTVSLSLGVSSGFSVYEAEILQEKKRIEETLLEDLEYTVIADKFRRVTLLSSVFVFITPLLAGVTTLIPFILVYVGMYSIEMGVRIAIIVDLSLVFISGYVFAVENRLMKGLRMMVLGIGVYLIGYMLNNLI